MVTDPQEPHALTPDELILILATSAIGGVIFGLLTLLTGIVGESRARALVVQILHEATTTILNLSDPADPTRH